MMWLIDCDTGSGGRTGSVPARLSLRKMTLIPAVFLLLKGLLKMFGVGLLAQSTIKLMSSMSLLRRRPSQVLRSLVSMHNMGLGAFLGLYCALFRVCINVMTCYRKSSFRHLV